MDLASQTVNRKKERNMEKGKEKEKRKKNLHAMKSITGEKDKKDMILPSSLLPHPQNAPWLVYFGHGKKERNHTFYSVENERCYVKNLPQLARKSCVMCSHGWLLMEDRYNEELTLINLTLMETIDIPPPPPLLPVKQSHQNSYFTYTMTAPPTDEGCSLFLTCSNNPFVKVFCLHEKKWFVMKFHLDEDGGLSNVVVLDGNFFGFTIYLRKFVSMIFDGYKPTIKYLNVEEPEDPFHGCNVIHSLIVSKGELYMLRTVEHLWTKNIDGFSVFKMNFADMRWEVVNSIENEVFFFNFDFESVSCSASEASLIGNSIYYVNEDNHVCRYNLANRGITMLRSFCHFWQGSHCWVLPKITENVMCSERKQSAQGYSRRRSECHQEYFIGHASDPSILFHRDNREKEIVNTGTTRFEADLPPELVKCIISRLSYFDSRCIGHAIPNWLPIVHEAPKPLDSWSIMNPPCLISFSNDYKTCTLMDPLRDMKFVIRSPELPCKVKILCCKYGWLLLMATDGIIRQYSLLDRDSLSVNIFFYNPLSKAIIQLPPYKFYHHTFSFTSPPTSSLCIVVAAHFSGYASSINICCKGDNQWTELDDDLEENDEVIVTLNTLTVFHKEKFHFLSTDGRIGLFDPVIESWEVCGQKEIVKKRMHRHYLVESNKGLFWVQATEEGGSIRVYKFDCCDNKWKETTSLEGLCFFLWRNSSISVSASSLGVKEETIYFSMLQDDHVVRYSLAQRKMFPKEKFYGVEELLLDSCWIEPCWIQHTNEDLKWF